MNQTNNKCCEECKGYCKGDVENKSFGCFCHQTNNRIREECSVDYNLSPQITEVIDKIIACVQDKNIYYHSNRIESVGKLIAELLKSQLDEIKDADNWKLYIKDEIDLALKSQREELVEKGNKLKWEKGIAGNYDLEAGRNQAIEDYQNLIKEDK